MAEPKGKYVKKGDVEEWEWDKDGPDGPKLTGGWVVPEGEFDPRADSDTRAPSEKLAEKASTSGGLRPAGDEPEPTKAEPKKADAKK